jgi:uncharacterized membrane protein required for colicin V production
MGDYAWVFDLTCLAIILGITYAVGSEGLYGAAIMFVNVMLAGLIAFSLYEPAGKMIGSIGFMTTIADFVSLTVIFGLAFSLIRFVTDYLGPWYVRFHGAVDQVGRYLFGLATGWYLVGMLVCMVQTAPVHKQFLGYQWQTHSLWGLGIDRFWLGFMQATTEKFFEWEPARPFDARNNFIVRYHMWRPFGEPDRTMPGFRQAPAQGAQPGAAGTGSQPAAPTGPPGGGGGRPPMDPTGATQQPNF